MSGLLIENLNKSFDGKTVLENISIAARAGELVVVLGPSGCGKSTLLRLIAGLEVVDSGKIILDGRDITTFEPQKRRTAMVFQNYALYPHMTVFENIAFPLKVARLPGEQVRRRVEETARLLELDTLLERRPSQLSGGQRQRVALGRGLIREPSIFLLDEPLSNLDAGLRVKMRQEIVTLQRRLGITMLYVTHDQVEALTMADTIAVLRNGTIHQTGTPAEIYNDPGDSFVASFIGSPAINLIEEQIKAGRGLLLPLEHENDISDGEYLVGIRPEHIRLDERGDLKGEICAAEYVGATINLKISHNRIYLTAAVSDKPGLLDEKAADQLIGRVVNFRVDSNDIFLFDRASGKRIRTTSSGN